MPEFSWKKLGVIYCPEKTFSWAQSHAMIPTPIQLCDDAVRVYYTTTDKHGVGRPSFIELDSVDLKNVRYVHSDPVLDIGAPGTFDENGVLACSVLRAIDGTLFMYYAGFELGTKIRYRLLTGLAISVDDGLTFSRARNTPVLDRSDSELYFRGGPFCMLQNGKYKMWYAAGSDWTIVNQKQMPVYDIRYCESDDGLHWPTSGRLAIGISEADEHGFGRPAILLNKDGSYSMFYSIRRKSVNAYRLGYATSKNGIDWVRRDNELNLSVSESGFDSSAIMYATPLVVNGSLYLFYNGNNFGEHGNALARLDGPWN